MDQINANAAHLIPMEGNMPMISFNQMNGVKALPFNNDNACAFMPNCPQALSKFDMLMDNFAAFKDILTTAYDGVSAMKTEGESIRDLIQQAKEEGITPELLDKIQAEVEQRLANIKNIKESTNYNGMNPFGGTFSLDIPDWRDYIESPSSDEARNEIKDMVASFDIDMNIEGDGFKIGGSAKINIGVTEDGALQISVEADMDFDLSGLLDKGVNSDEAMNMINEFLGMLGMTQNDFGTTLGMLDSIWNRTMDSMEKKALPDGLEITTDSSNSLKGHIAQQASITLDGMAGQMPNIAINIL